MAQATDTNGLGVDQTPNEGAHTPSPSTPGGERPIPENTKVDVDRPHRLMIEQWAGFYYPGLAPKDRPALSVLLAEMIETAYDVGEDDPQRPETPTERRARRRGAK